MCDPEASLAILPEDTPLVAQTKSEPLGQILGTSASSGKKTSKPKDSSALPSIGLSGSIGFEPTINDINGATAGTLETKKMGTIYDADVKESVIARLKKNFGGYNRPDPSTLMPPIMPITPIVSFELTNLTIHPS